MNNAGFWDPLISPWWRSWGILYRTTCQVFSTPVAISLGFRSVNPRIPVNLSPAVLMGFPHVRVRSIPASWPQLRVLGGAASPSLNDSRVHRMSVAIPTPRLLNGVGASSFSVQTLSVPLGKVYVPNLNSIACALTPTQPCFSFPLLQTHQAHLISLQVLRTTNKPLSVPAFKHPKALGLNIPKQTKPRLALTSLVFSARAVKSTERALRLAVVRSPLPAHRFKVEQRHEFRNQLALSVADVPPEKILIRYVVDRVPVTGVARFTPREDGTLSWTWNQDSTNPTALNSNPNLTIKAQLAGWVVVGQRLDTRTPVMTLVMPATEKR